MRLAALLPLAFALTAPAAALAAPAVVFDMGGKFDKSFNEAAFRGIERWKKETGKPALEFEIANESQREQALRRMAERGATPVIGIGFGQGSAIEKIAKEFPKLQFTIIDAVANQPNVQSVIFKEQEGSFLVGMIAALTSKTGKVGYIGGMDIPLIRKFQCGYDQGVHYANPKAEVFVNMVGTTATAWNDPARGGELARAQFSKGADVIFAAGRRHRHRRLPGRQGLEEVRDRRHSNQNHIQPRTMLTSMVKRVESRCTRRRRTTSRGWSTWASRRTAWTTPRPAQREAHLARGEEEVGRGQGRHHRPARSRSPTS